MNVAVVIGECHTILLALNSYCGERVGRWFTQIHADKKRRYLKVERWNGSLRQTLPDYILRHPGQACLTRDPVF